MKNEVLRIKNLRTQKLKNSKTQTQSITPVLNMDISR